MCWIVAALLLFGFGVTIFLKRLRIRAGLIILRYTIFLEANNGNKWI